MTSVLQACSVRVTGAEVLLQLVKAESGAWPHLCLGGRKLPLVGVDFDRWDDGPKEGVASAAHDTSVFPFCLPA